MAQNKTFVGETESLINSTFHNETVNPNCTFHNADSHDWFSNLNSIDAVQLVINSIGVVGNLLLFLVLFRNPLGAKMATIFFMHQSCIDMAVCGMAALMIIQPTGYQVGSLVFDYLNCHLWHSQMLFWLFVQLSVINLVLIGLERYWAVVYPIYYSKIRPKRQAFVCISIAAVYNCSLSIPNLFETQFVEKCGLPRCKHRPRNKLMTFLFSTYSVVLFVCYYCLTLVLLLVFYCSVIWTLNKRKPVQSTQLSIKKDRATRQFTKMALVITLVYVVSMTYNYFAYMLGSTGIWHYVNGSLPQQLGRFSVSVNSLANPIIYFLIVMRRSFLAKICPPGQYDRSNTHVDTVSRL